MKSIIFAIIQFLKTNLFKGDITLDNYEGKIKGVGTKVLFTIQSVANTLTSLLAQSLKRIDAVVELMEQSLARLRDLEDQVDSMLTDEDEEAIAEYIADVDELLNKPRFDKKEVIRLLEQSKELLIEED
jgi:hypothetical protein